MILEHTLGSFLPVSVNFLIQLALFALSLLHVRRLLVKRNDPTRCLSLLQFLTLNRLLHLICLLLLDRIRVFLFLGFAELPLFQDNLQLEVPQETGFAIGLQA